MFIDPPTPFDKRKAWQQFAREMEHAKRSAIDPTDRADIERHLEIARRELEANRQPL
ncbi:hypothetical protein ACSBOB_06665 [Mesorhizobium sp. ASY16-5R]|uniref:hypothetical protein n=1 Tax=Mesorhizobium sp. ASY16-5R TaxID=3445772 RepID=UPI003F9FFD33